MQWILRTGFSRLKPLTWITSSAVIPSNPTQRYVQGLSMSASYQASTRMGSEMLLHLSDDTDGHPSQNSASGFHDMKYMRDPVIWSKSMSRIAFFPSTISKTEIHRTFL